MTERCQDFIYTGLGNDGLEQCEQDALPGEEHCDEHDMMGQWWAVMGVE